MKLFLISQDSNNAYDTYDKAIVCAEDEKSAKYMRPYNTDDEWNGKMEISESGLILDAWCNVEDVKVEYIGEARQDLKKSVICASYCRG